MYGQRLRACESENRRELSRSLKINQSNHRREPYDIVIFTDLRVNSPGVFINDHDFEDLLPASSDLRLERKPFFINRYNPLSSNE